MKAFDIFLQNDWVVRYGLSLAAVALALLVRVAQIPFLGEEAFSFTPFLVAVVFCAWYCGFGPSVMTAALSIVIIWYFFFEPRYSFRLVDPSVQLPMFGSFALYSGLIIGFGESNRRAHAELEKRLQKRTAQLSEANKRLLQMQDDERRRIARELHDSLGQLLAANKMSLGNLKRLQLPAKAIAAMSDCEAVTEEALRQIRTISSLLHPPLLDEVGLLAALRWSVNEFSKRSGISIRFTGPEQLARLDPDIEIAAFRFVQECLTNILRHSGSPDGVVELVSTPTTLEVIVLDHGIGMFADKLSKAEANVGVGLKGMEERIHELGGTLAIHSGGTGTKVTASLRLRQASPQTSENRNAASA